MTQTQTIEWLKTTATHEITVVLSESTLTNDAYYFVGIDCIADDGVHQRATVMSRHEDRHIAIRHAERLHAIIEWRRSDIDYEEQEAVRLRKEEDENFPTERR